MIAIKSIIRIILRACIFSSEFRIRMVTNMVEQLKLTTIFDPIWLDKSEQELRDFLKGDDYVNSMSALFKKYKDSLPASPGRVQGQCTIGYNEKDGWFISCEGQQNP